MSAEGCEYHGKWKGTKNKKYDTLLFRKSAGEEIISQRVSSWNERVCLPLVENQETTPTTRVYTACIVCIYRRYHVYIACTYCIDSTSMSYPSRIANLSRIYRAYIAAPYAPHNRPNRVTRNHIHTTGSVPIIGLPIAYISHVFIYHVFMSLHCIIPIPLPPYL